MTSGYFHENVRILQLRTPSTIVAETVPSSWIDMATYQRVTFFVAVDLASSGGASFRVYQGKDSAGTGSKQKSPPIGASILSFGGGPGYFFTMEVLAESLDIANGYTHVALDVWNVSGSLRGCIFAFCHAAREVPVAQTADYLYSQTSEDEI